MCQGKKKNDSIPKRVRSLSPSSSTGIKPKGCMYNEKEVGGV